MKILARYLFLLLLIPSTLWAQAKECNKIVISSDSDYAPLHWYDGKQLTGASIEIAVTALSALGVSYELRYMGPFYRVLQGAQRGEIDMISSLKDTPERRDYLAFTTVPLFSNPIAVFVSRNSKFSYSKWNDLINKKGGVTQGYQYGNGFDDFMKSHLNVEAVQKTYMNFKKIELGRIDYLVTGYYSGLAYLAASEQQDKFVALKPYISETDNFIAFSKESPCLKYLPGLNLQLEKMKNDGRMKKILDKHVALLH